MKLVLLLATVLCLLVTSRAEAQRYKYMDESGNIIFTDDISRIPPRFRSQVIKPSPTPFLTEKGIREQEKVFRDRQREIEKEKKKKEREKLKQEKKNKKKKKGKAQDKDDDDEEDREVVLYITSNCPDCKDLEHFLKRNHIKYSKFDVEQSDKGAKFYEKIGGGDIPMLKVNARVMKGYNKEVTKKLLGLDDPEKR